MAAKKIEFKFISNGGLFHGEVELQEDTFLKTNGWSLKMMV